MTFEAGDSPPGFVRCAQCSQPIAVRTSRCWQCGFPVSGSLRAHTEPGRPLAAAMVILSVFAIALLGLLALGIRGSPTPVAVASERDSVEPTIGSPTSLPTPSPSTPKVGDGEYVVVRGDDLIRVSFATGVDLELLRFWNAERYPAVASGVSLTPGWVLRITGPPLPSATARPVARATPVPGAGGGSGSSVGGGSAWVSLPILTVDVWNAAESYFSISGTTPNELLQSARTNVPAHCLEWSGQAVACAGPSSQTVDPTYVVSAGGACTLTGAQVSVMYTATLPQWTAPSEVPAKLVDWWRAAIEHIRWHEEQHVRIFADQYSRLPALLQGQPCDAASSLFDAWYADVIAAQEAFHVEDANWVPPPYYGP